MTPINSPAEVPQPTVDGSVNSGAQESVPQSVLSAPPTRPLVIRIIGVGGAGGNVVAHMATTDLRQLRPLALHTSSRILETIQAPEKMLLGSELTHGLGAGGDPSLARAAAERDLPQLRNLVQDVDLLFVVAGLGGGTGTGVAPVLARIAKEAGALVIGVATLPFDIEGARRRRQAQQGYTEFLAAADTVVCLPNQKIFRIVDENTTVLESLKLTNNLLSQGIRGIWQMLTRPSLIHVDYSHLCSLLRDRHADSAFATAEAQGEGRAREVIEQVLACPLLEGGDSLAEAEAVLVNLTGGPDLSMADIKRVMDELNRRTDNAQLVMGASIAEEMQGRVGLSLVSCRRNGSHSSEAAAGERMTISPTAPAPSNRLTPGQRSERFHSGEQPPQIDPELQDNPEVPYDRPGLPVKFSPRRLQQGRLKLDIVSKGRFEKSPPTIHRGEDLDVPTYVRRGIPLN